jgi:hypothetical protein
LLVLREAKPDGRGAASLTYLNEMIGMSASKKKARKVDR